MEVFTALLVSLSAVLIALLLSSYWRILNYWEKRHIPQDKPVPLFGNFVDVIAVKMSAAQWMKKLYDKFDVPYFGIHIFQKPFLVIKDPELVKEVLIRDFDAFSDRAVAESKHDVVCQHMLFFQKGMSWKMTRAKLTTMFSTGKLRTMMENFNTVGTQLTSIIKDEEIETRLLASRYATEVTLKSFFGVTANSFGKEKSMVHAYVQDVMGTSIRNGFAQTCFFFMHSWVNVLGLRFIKESTSDFFMEIFKDILKERRGTRVKHNDITDTILDMLEDKEFCEKTEFGKYPGIYVSVLEA